MVYRRELLGRFQLCDNQAFPTQILTEPSGTEASRQALRGREVVEEDAWAREEIAAAVAEG